MHKIITTALKLQLWRPLDVQFARFISTKKTIFQNALILASACLSANTKDGHTCLPLNLLSPKKLFQGCHPLLAYQAWQLVGKPSINDWEKILLSSQAVSNGSFVTPLILVNKKLYTHRMWQYENIVANFFKNTKQPIKEKNEDIINILNIFFPKNNKKPNWQKIAAAMAITNKITLIFGGPGTGKTTLIVKILATLISINKKQHFDIKIAAPTGKAARKLSESLIKNSNSLKLTNDQKKQLCQKTTTIHKLLGIQPVNQKITYHNNNKLRADILIIDETSMIDLAMMANLIEALQPNTKTIFLGDHCQLSSVDPGSVLEDLYIYAKKKYSKTRAEEISHLTGYSLSTINNNEQQNIGDSTCFLQKNYRFNKHSGINNLANAIKQKNKKNILKILNSNLYQDISCFFLKKKEDYKKMIIKCLSGYQNYFYNIKRQKTPKKILEEFNLYKILCAVNEGPYGIQQINKHIENTLLKKTTTAKHFSSLNHISNYTGRPIMITINDTSIELFNGDMGIILPDKNQKLQAYFLLTNNNIRTVPINLLPEHETSFAITVHKAQGSEFKQISLILPNKKLPILTKELLYTAITRTQQHFCLYTTYEIIMYTINNHIKRYGGLIEKLKS